MPRARDPNRTKAFEIYKSKKGKIDLVEIASQLNVSPGTIRGWKSKDNWDEKVNGTLRKNTERSKRKNGSPEEKEIIPKKEVKSVLENSNLTDKQKLFCLYFIKSFNATKAYQKAYDCSYATAGANGYEALKNTEIKKEIERLKQEKLNQAFLSESDIFQKYMDIAFADISDYLSWQQEEVPVMGPFGPIKVKNEETGEEVQITKMVNTVRFKNSESVDGTIIAEVKQGRDGASIKLADRMKALEWLSDHMNMATEEQKTRIEVMRAKAQLDEKEETADDGFLEALKGTAAEDWADED